VDPKTLARLAKLAADQEELIASAEDSDERDLIVRVLSKIRQRAAARTAAEAESEQVNRDISLHSSIESGTLGTEMSTADVSWGAAIAKARRKARWPFQRALDKIGKSLPEWARERGAKVENVKSWLKKPGHGGRPVPRVWAERIAKEFPTVRAVPESWPNGIRE